MQMDTDKQWIKQRWCVDRRSDVAYSIHNDLRRNTDLASAVRNAWLVPGQDFAAVELPSGDSEGHGVPLTQQEKQSHFKSVWHFVPHPKNFLMRSFYGEVVSEDGEFGPIVADRCTNGFIV